MIRKVILIDILICVLFRTILGLVYTALKLCMDINPALFDECANQYKLQRQMERKRHKDREDNWKALQQKVSVISENPVPDVPKPASPGDAFSFPAPQTIDEPMEVEEEEDEILTDEETDAEPDHTAEHTDAIHPDMVIVFLFTPQ